MISSALKASSVLILFLVICFWPVFWDGGSLFPQPDVVYGTPSFGYQNDELEELLPWRTLTHRFLRQGEFPFWNSYAGLGMPLAANNQSGAFALSTWVSLWITDPADAFSFGYLLILFFAAFSVYGFLRVYNCRILTALMGAMLFIFQGSLWWDFSNYQPRNWAAISLFFLSMGLKRSPLFFPFAFLSIGFMFLSTNLQVAGYGLVTLWLYLMVEIFETRQNRSRFFWVAVHGTLAAIFVGAVQIMATLELLGESTHTFSHGEISLGVIGMEDQLSLLLTYLGPVGIALCIIGRGYCSKTSWLFFILAAIVPVLSFGISFHPSLNVDNNYYLMPFIFLTPILFGWGCEALWLREKQIYRIGIILLIFALKIAVLNLYLHWPEVSLFQTSASSAQLQEQLPRFRMTKKTIPPRLIRFRTQNNLGPLSPIVFDDKSVRQELPPNLPILAGFADLQIYDSFIPGRLTDWFTRMEPGSAFRHPLDLRILCLKRLSTLASPLFAQMSPEWLLSGEILDMPEWKLIYKMLPGTCLGNAAPLYLYRNTNVLPRASLADLQGTVKISNYSASEIQLQVSAKEDTDLIFREMFYPGWKASVSGEPVPIYPENHIFRKISIKKGNHTVVFRYRPEWLFPGIVLSGVGILGLISLFGLCRKMHFQNPKALNSGQDTGNNACQDYRNDINRMAHQRKTRRIPSFNSEK